MGQCGSSLAVPIGPSEPGVVVAGKREVYFVVNTAQGRRDYMEDMVLVQSAPKSSALNGCAIFAIFDGHGGYNVSDYAKEHFMKVLNSNIKEHGPLDGLDKDTIHEAIKDSFLDLDDHIGALPNVIVPVPSSGCLGGGPRQVYKDIGFMGSTANVVVMNAKSLIFANCGDSRAILVSGGKLKFSTTDHQPVDPEEVKRVQRAGGFVEGDRVDGILAVSRALGDHQFKMDENLKPEEQKVIAVPVLTTIPRDKDRDQFLVLASDGLWGVMSSEDVAGFVLQRVVGEGMPLDLCAQHLNNFAVNQLYSSDNMSITIVDLRKPYNAKRASKKGVKPGPRV